MVTARQGQGPAEFGCQPMGPFPGQGGDGASCRVALPRYQVQGGAHAVPAHRSVRLTHEVHHRLPPQWHRRAVRSASRMPCCTTAQVPPRVTKKAWW